MSGTQDVVECGRCVGANAAVHTNECWQAIKDENTALRAIAVKVQCVYGMTKDGVCQLGFPGCACADDVLCWDMERSAKVGEALQRIRKSLVTLETLPLILTGNLPTQDFIKTSISNATKLIKEIRDAVDSLSRTPEGR
jgi:hypothetical protein